MKFLLIPDQEFGKLYHIPSNASPSDGIKMLIENSNAITEMLNDTVPIDIDLEALQNLTVATATTKTTAATHTQPDVKDKQ